jgi:hypothetical protein
MNISIRNVVNFSIFATAMAFTTGCAPAMMAPSTVPMGMGKSAEIGLGAMMGKSESPLLKAAKDAGMFSADATGADDHLNYNGWVRFNMDEEDRESSELGILAQAGAYSLMSAGMYWRKPVFLASESTMVGLQVDAGWAWAGVGLPIAFQMVDNFWLTVQPSARASLYSSLHLPVGLAYEVADWFRIDLSGGIHSFVLPHYTMDSIMYYGATSLALQF